MVLGFGAGQAHHPAFGLLRDLRSLGPMVLVPKAHRHPRRQGLVDAFVNGGTGQAKIPMNGLDRHPVGIAQKDGVLEGDSKQDAA